MDIAELFKGVAVVIDDEIEDKSANIWKIIRQLDEKSIPYLQYKKIPTDEVINHLQNISFLLLDWRLIKEDIASSEIEEGVSVPQTLKVYDAGENIEFLEKIKGICFCPVFVFTNEVDIETIKESLQSAKLMSSDKPNYIFIKNKNEIEDGTLFSSIENWIKETPSIYVLKEWEKEYQKTVSKLFSDFHAISPVWPRIMWKTFDADGVNKSLELGELISRNLYTRMTPFEFDDAVLGTLECNMDRDELRRVLEGERFLPKGRLHPDDISTGDVFKEEYDDSGETKYKYWLNIRAQCDLVRTDNPDLYCISGDELIQKANGKIDKVSFSSGQYLEKVHQAIIPFMDSGKILEFNFVNFEIKNWSDIKEKRIGRLLPPYITKTQQRYALYLQRQGLPRIPDEAIFDKSS